MCALQDHQRQIQGEFQCGYNYSPFFLKHIQCYNILHLQTQQGPLGENYGIQVTNSVVSVLDHVVPMHLGTVHLNMTVEMILLRALQASLCELSYTSLCTNFYHHNYYMMQYICVLHEAIMVMVKIITYMDYYYYCSPYHYNAISLSLYM